MEDVISVTNLGELICGIIVKSATLWLLYKHVLNIPQGVVYFIFAFIWRVLYIYMFFVEVSVFVVCAYKL
jgi:hypothetical protein